MVAGLVVDEDCPCSRNEWGGHCDHWYEDEGCHYCGTQEPNLLVIEEEADTPDADVV